MKIEDIDLDKIQALADFYPIFDQYALHLAKDHDITDLLLKYRNKTTSDEEKQKIQWELETILYSFHGKRVFSFSSSNGKEPGDITEFPKLDEYQGKAFEYIKMRAQSSQSSFLRARFNHLLWSSILQKNTSLAKEAADNYLQTIKECNALNESSSEFAHFIGQLLENLIGLVNESKLNVEAAKNLTKTLLFASPNLPFWTKHGIIDDMLKFPKIFKVADFDNVLSIFENHLKQPKGKTDDFQLANYHLPTALRVAQKTKKDVRRWYNEIGEAFLRLAECEGEEKRAWIKLNYYRLTIDALRQAGNSERKQEIEQRYFELKPKVTLDEIRIDFDEETVRKLKASQQKLQEKAQYFLKQNPQKIYATIATGSFFPKYQEVSDAAKAKESSFLDFATTLQFDRNKNIKQKSLEENNREDVLEAYGFRVRHTLLPFLHYIIVFGIQSGHLTSRNLLRYLVQHTWIGKPHIKVDLGGNLQQANWVFQIAPAIAEFFNQVLAWGESKYYTPSFILCIDSLTLKLEGLFRNFTERIGISASIGKRNGVQEMLAHDVFNNETVRQYFNEEDMLLFDYVFSNQGGLNLRNNIAHCFYHESEFHPDKMLLLLAVLLRLGKYNLTTKNRPSGNGQRSFDSFGV